MSQQMTEAWVADVVLREFLAPVLDAMFRRYQAP
jgi:hypothetical protein